MSDRYGCLADARLAATLRHEDAREDAGQDVDRVTCYTHRRWATDCANHLMHRDPVDWALADVLGNWRTR